MLTRPARPSRVRTPTRPFLVPWAALQTPGNDHGGNPTVSRPGSHGLLLWPGAPQTRHIPVIALTADAMSGDREKAVEAGCEDYDTKPVELPRLLTNMESPSTRT